MASCDNTVLSGQEGLIQFKPLGTTTCIDDYCPWVGDRVYVGCTAEYEIDDCVTVEAVKIPVGEGVSDGTDVLADGDTFYVVNDGVGIAGDVDNCGNDMEGVPYVELSATQGGAPITWDVTNAGELATEGVLTGSFVPTTAGAGYNGAAVGEVKGVEVIDLTGSGTGAVVTITTGATGDITNVEVTSGGRGYLAGATLGFEAENGIGTDASHTLGAANVVDVRTDSKGGSYTLRLCEFQTVCGVRSFSIDLSRDELDVTTLPCEVSTACGKELASFRKTQAGFASATGSLEVYFTCDQTSLQNRLLQSSLQKTQGGASVRLFVCVKTDASGEIIEEDSMFIEADIQLLGMSFSVNPDDPTTATINFGVTSVANAFGMTSR